MSDTQRESAAIQHWKQTGVILPGHQSEIAAWIADHNGEQ